MVPGAGVEPARRLRRGIFLPSTAFAAAYTQNAFVVWTLPLPYHGNTKGVWFNCTTNNKTRLLPATAAPRGRNDTIVKIKSSLNHDLGRSHQVSTLSLNTFVISNVMRNLSCIARSLTSFGTPTADFSRSLPRTTDTGIEIT